MGSSRTRSRTDCCLLSVKCHSCELGEWVRRLLLERGPSAYLNLCISALLAPPGLLRATTAAMEISFDTFPVFQPQKPLQIIPYNGPPEPKQSSRRYPSKKAPFSEDEHYDIDEILGIEPRSNTQRNNSGDLAPTLHGVEVMALTCLGRHLYSRRSNFCLS